MRKSPLRFTLIFLGRTKKIYLAEAIADYTNRLGHYASVSTKIIKEKSFSAKVPAARVMAEEAKQIVGHIGPNEFVVSLDSGGGQCSSEKLASYLDDWQEMGKHRVTIIIGGANGLSKEVLQRSQLILSLSKLTFTHDMARFIILEQIYRAFTILARTGYHR